MFRRQNLETAKRTCDPDVEVVDSIIGQSVVRAGLGLGQKRQDQRVLCLNGGGNQGKDRVLDEWHALSLMQVITETVVIMPPACRI